MVEWWQALFHEPQTARPAAIPQTGLGAGCFVREASCFLCCLSELPRKLTPPPARDDTSPAVPELLVCIGQLTENNIPKAPSPSVIQPLSNHTSQRSASSKAKSKSCASSLRLTWPNRT